jgi:hypothetical protein
MGRGLPFIAGITGDARAMARFAIDKCKKVTLTDQHYNYCLAGLFNQLGQRSIKGEYGLSVDKKNPLSLCDEQEGVVKTYCYRNFEWAGLSLVGDLTKTRQAFEKLEDIYGTSDPDRLRSSVFNLGYELGRNVVGENTADYKHEAESCGELPAIFINDCVEGVSVGIAKNGEPNLQYKYLIAFCKAVKRSISQEEVICPSTYSLEYLKGFYTPALFKKACSEIEEVFRNVCGNINKRNLN